jgi:NADH-quinone oxidoreductase subunit L
MQAILTPDQEHIRQLLVCATLAPLVSSIITLFFGTKVLKQFTGWFAVILMSFSLVCALIAAFIYTQNEVEPFSWLIPWIPVPGRAAGYLYLGLFCDHLTIALMCMVTLISTLVHVYSIGYMEGDSRFERFFCYMSAFTFSMLGIVTANGLMQLFVFWELVGLTSYLLIGFWFEKKGPQLACKKAFVMNRIGDTGFLIGFGILFAQLGGKVLLPSADGGMFDTLAIELGGKAEIMANPPMWLTVAGIALFFGAIGKSAQFPLHTWLPDAMEGPTPVSSIVHSATMVAAGVYLTARIYPILTPAAHLFVCIIGLITLVMAGFMAMVMTDIKRVLAYSTLSQLGYMILGVGSGAYIFALFHLITHAFFKCCLFQCSGSVINMSHHQQDMRFYGGLGKKMPITAICYGICTLTISGIGIGSFSVLSGFYSKDGIIAGAANYAHELGGWGSLFLWGPLVIAYVTPFYMARSFALTFMGKPRDQHLYDHVHEAPKTMWVPQAVLALFAIISVPYMVHWLGMIEKTQEMLVEKGVTWMPSAHAIETGHGAHGIHLPLLFGLAGAVMIGVGIWMYKDGMGKAEYLLKKVPGLKLLHTWALNKFYFDHLYDIFIVNVAKAFSRLCGFIDLKGVDGLVNLAGYWTKGTAWFTGWFDNKVVDGLVNGAANTARAGGQALRFTQPGRIRVYVSLLFAGLIIALMFALCLVA